MKRESGIIAAFKSKKARNMARGAIASFLGMFVMACSGCGGGGGSSSAPADVSMPPKLLTIVAEGDSTMYGLQLIGGEHGQTLNSAPSELQIELRAVLGNTITVVNNGVPGATIDASLRGASPYAGTPFTQRLAATPAQIVIANFGINDSMAMTASQYQTDLESFIAIVRAAGKTPILEEPNPVCDSPTQSANLDALVPIMRSVAQQHGVTLIQQYDYIRSLPNWQGMLPDCIHPNDALYKIKADREYQVLLPIVEKLQGS